ncbi:hypothetical protein ACET3X_007410 [Alternaria dauci]|uniref:Epidermal growth factor receptor-like transmembrane-juxtamembrane segment domain-containing protein n=1 Tax=Alternaria dauci TaxID=48095 RepID=A0ABR3UCD9_9PLEO
MADPSYTAAKPGDFFCPSGGTWYACETGTKFLGCCMSDPCVHGCFGDMLRPAGRSSSLYNLSPGGSCGGNTPMWTCNMAPTFWGCCNEDPCMNNSTCPEGELEPSFWDRPDQYYYFHDLNVALSSTVPAATAFSTASSTSTTPPSETSSTAAAASPSKVSSAVIGGAVGGSVGFLIIIAAIVFFLWRRRRNQKQKTVETEAASTSVIPKAELASPTSPSGFSPPPTYSWDHAGPNSQPVWAHYQMGHQELAGDTTRAELCSPSGSGPAELHGDSEARELESPQNSPEVAQGTFVHDTSKQQAHGLGVSVTDTARLNAHA